MARKKIYTDKKPPEEVETPEVETIEQDEPKKGMSKNTKIIIALVTLVVAIITVYLIREMKKNDNG